jgi:ribosomal protein S13
MKLTNSLIKQIIKEAIADRIKMIDEAGDIAAIEAKINKVEEDIRDAMEVKSALTGMEGLKYYVSPEIISDMMTDMESSISELQTKKKDLEDQKKTMAKNTKGPKKPKKEEEKKDELTESKKSKSSLGKKTK